MNEKLTDKRYGTEGAATLWAAYLTARCPNNQFFIPVHNQYGQWRLQLMVTVGVR